MTGPERVEASLDYVYGGKTSSGFDRLVEPKTVCGTDPGILSELGRDYGLQHPNPATIGSLNIAEQLSWSQVQGISASLFDFAFAGIDESQWAYHAVRHEKRLKLSGLISTDIHFIILNALLGSGRAFIPYFPKADYFGFKVWAEKQNYLHRLTSKWDPAKRRIVIPRVYSYDTDEVVLRKRDIGTLVGDAYRAGRLLGPDDVVDLLGATSDITSVERKGQGVTVGVKGIERPLQLHAAVFSPEFDLHDLQAEINRQQRMTKEECDEVYDRILKARIERHHERYGRSGPRWAIKPKKLSTDQTKNRNELPLFFSQSGQLWRRAIELDAKHGSALLRLGKTCDELGRRLGQVGSVLVECLEETEPIGGGRGGAESIVADVGRAIEGVRHGGEVLRRAALGAERALAEPRATAVRDGRIAETAHRFHGAIQQLGGVVAGYPRSVAEVIRAIEEFFRRRTMPPRNAAWFTNVSRLELRPDIWEWLRFTAPAETDDLKELIEAVRDLQNPTEDDRRHDVPFE